MRLSKRLHAVAQLASEAEKVADIGTDHAYIPIYLIEEKGIQSALAMDINKGPLERAKENIRMHGLEERIETRLSDGLAELKAGEVDTVVIAGMGGALTVQILREGSAVLDTVETLVLQPQSEIEMVRRFLHSSGYYIAQEDMELDEDKYYPMMKVRHGIQQPWKDYEYKYGKFLVGQQNPVLAEFLDRELAVYQNIRAGLLKKDGEHIIRRQKEVEEEIHLIEQAKEAMR